MRRRNAPAASIADLVADDRLQRITPDLREATDLLAHSVRHVQSARLLSETDPPGAYQLAYDAVRKAVAAVMLADGYRARGDRPGAHAAVVIYAEEALSGSAPPDSLANLDQMRRSRNRSEYGAVVVGQAQLMADIAHAESIVEAARARVIP